MKKLLICMFSFVLGACQTKENETFTKESLQENLTSFDNKQASFQSILDQHKGKKILIKVWASWCSDCIKDMPNVKALEAKTKNVVFLNLSCDKSYESWVKGVEKFEVKGENYLIADGMKGVFGKSIKLDWIPRYMVVDENGKIVVFRAIEASDEALTKALL